MGIVDISIADTSVAYISKTDKWLYKFNCLITKQELMFIDNS